VTYSPAILAEHLLDLEKKASRPARFVIAFSGGLDSSVLAQSLAELKKHDQRFKNVPVVAIHIDHGLQRDSPDWSEQCASMAAELNFEYRSLCVNVQLESGKGPEASARDARYSALHAELRDDDWLLSAHHREDQAETLLLNLIRGTGPAGVAGIGDVRRFGPGWLVRPMLNVDRSDILQYATDIGLTWVEDPSNKDRRFDRNFLRHEILPRLKSRWPDIAARLQRSAGHAGEASQLLVDLAEIDLVTLGACSARLPVDGLLQLSAARQRNVIRYALRDLGLSTPTAMQLERIRKEVVPARIDAQPLVSWRGASVRRYQNGLYLLPEKLADAIETVQVSGNECQLGDGLGVLKFEPCAGPGLSEALLKAGVTIRPRVGGEEIKLQGQSHTSKLKKLLQETRVVPWMRDRLPLIYSGDRLLAVGDLWLAADATAEPGIEIHWIGRPALH
jgi:tRNA(Ile)-lysidine synthase